MEEQGQEHVLLQSRAFYVESSQRPACLDTKPLSQHMVRGLLGHFEIQHKGVDRESGDGLVRSGCTSSGNDQHSTQHKIVTLHFNGASNVSEASCMKSLQKLADVTEDDDIHALQADQNLKGLLSMD